MNFLYPGFLFALIAVVLPIIIHLFNFRKFKKVYFSNVQLLKAVEQQNSSKKQLKNLLILLSRVLAVTFLVLAFAQPYIPLNHQKNATLTNTVSVYIDNSYSMEAINKDGSLLDEAKRRAKDLVKKFGLNDRFQILTNDFEGKHQRLLNADEFLKAVDDVKISASSRSLQQILNRQENIFTSTSNKYSFILSDFQKNMADRAELSTKPDIQYAFLMLNATPLPNVAVDSAWMLSPNHQPGASEKLVVKVKNYSDKEAVNIPLKLSLNNKQMGQGSITVPAGKVKLDTLSFSGLKAGWQKGVISIKDFPLTFDDTLNFSFKVESQLPVLSINGLQAGHYIKTLFAVDHYYKLTENLESNINYNNFSNYRLIVLNGLKNPSTGLAEQLKKYLLNGGAVVVLPNLDADIQTYNAFLGSLNLPLVQSLNVGPVQVDRIELSHPIFKTVFEQIPKNLELPTVNRYFLFKESNRLSKENILQLPGGQLFFAQYNIGNGHAYIMASGLGNQDGNIARSLIFVPLMYRISTVNSQGQSFFNTLGKDVALETKKITLGKNQILKLSDQSFETIPELRHAEGKTFIYVADQLKKPGFYSLTLADSLLAVYSFNTTRTESDLHYLSKMDIDKIKGKANLHLFDVDKDSIKLTADQDKIGHTLWKLCLILSLIFIAIEILLIKFYHHSIKTT